MVDPDPGRPRRRVRRRRQGPLSRVACMRVGWVRASARDPTQFGAARVSLGYALTLDPTYARVFVPCTSTGSGSWASSPSSSRPSSLIEQGLTGVVGPNGCGKSNLLEALRWVMGETSHKSMRAAAMDDVIFSGTQIAAGAQHRRSDDLHRQQRPPGAGRVQRQRHAGGHAPHRARGGLGLPHQRPRGARPRRAHPVRGRGHRRALAGAGAPGPDRRDRQRQARAAPPHPGGRRRHRRPAQPPPRGRAAAARRRGQPRPPQRHPGPAQLADREPEAAGAAGAALQGALGRDPQARRRRAAPALDGGAGARSTPRRPTSPRRWRRSARATEAEAKALSAEAEAADQLQPLREQEAAKGAVLHRFKIEQENLEREAQRTAERQRELRGPRRAARPRSWRARSR